MSRHPLDLAAMAAYGAFAANLIDPVTETAPAWDALPPEVRADWRAVADAVQMVIEAGIRAEQRERDAQLADQHGVTVVEPGGPFGTGVLRPFGDLLREQP